MNISASSAPRAPTDSSSFTLFGYAVIVFGIFGFILWAVITPLASAVIAPGVVKVDTSRKAAQHLEGGVVEEVLVRDGDIVNAGDVLLRLDATQAQAQLAIIEGSYIASLAQHARLVAERDEAIERTERELTQGIRRVQFQNKLWVVLAAPAPPLIVALVVYILRARRENIAAPAARLKTA